MLDNTTRLLIAEDQTLMAEGLRSLLEAEFALVEIAGEGSDLFTSIDTFKPDVILLSMELRVLNSIQVARQIRRVSQSKIVMLTAHEESQYLIEALRVGACGYVMRRSTCSELVKAIRQVVNGEIYVASVVPRPERASAAALNPTSDSRPLTFRQREVLKLVAEGYTAKEIANFLHLSVKTAVFHKMAIKDKLGLRTTAALTRYALEMAS